LEQWDGAVVAGGSMRRGQMRKREKKKQRGCREGRA